MKMIKRIFRVTFRLPFSFLMILVGVLIMIFTLLRYPFMAKQLKNKGPVVESGKSWAQNLVDSKENQKWFLLFDFLCWTIIISTIIYFLK